MNNRSKPTQISTFQARADREQRAGRPGTIRACLLAALIVGSAIPAVNFVEYVARKTAATVNKMGSNCPEVEVATYRQASQ
jgi:hypothetical protein